MSVRQPSHELDLTSALDLPPGVTAPVAVRTVAPQFPWWRLREGLEGEASVICDIDATGVVLDAAVFSATCHDFGDAALAAVRQWRFAPGTRDGLPVRVRALVPIQFEFNSPLPKSLPGQVAQR